MSKITYVFIFGVVFFFFSQFKNVPMSRIIYVNAKSNCTKDCDGSSWDKALKDLQSAIDSVKQTEEKTTIFVAAGEYKPTGGMPGATGRDRSFLFNCSSVVGVDRCVLEIYGGFSGNETVSGNEPEDDKKNKMLELRDISKKTILSGDFNDNDDSTKGKTDNAYHVLIIKNGGQRCTVVLDGLTIEGGCADGNGSHEGINRGVGAGIFAHNIAINKVRYALTVNLNNVTFKNIDSKFSDDRTDPLYPFPSEKDENKTNLVTWTITNNK